MVILMIPITAFVVGFLVLFSVYIGLKWNTLIKDNKPIEKPFENPIPKIMEKKEQKKLNNVLDEWFNGAEEERK